MAEDDETEYSFEVTHPDGWQIPVVVIVRAEIFTVCCIDPEFIDAFGRNVVRINRNDESSLLQKSERPWIQSILNGTVIGCRKP